MILGLAICLVLTGAFFGKIFNRMNMITLADFYFRRYGNVTEIMSGTLMSISFIVLVAGNLASKWIHSIRSIGNTANLCYVNFYRSSIIVHVFRWTVLLCLHRHISYLSGIVGFWLGFIYFISPWSPIPGGLETIIANVPGNFMDMSGLLAVTNPASGALINWATIISLGIGDIVALDFMEREYSG